MRKKQSVMLLSVPNLRERDVANMPNLRQVVAGGEIAELTPSFPCLTCPVQANMLTGVLPSQHGIVANGFFWRERKQVEMWTSPYECFERPLLWQHLRRASPPRTSAVWFALHTKGADADLVCTPAPIHHPDGRETSWCYTQPSTLYEQLREQFGDFPLHHYWGPLAGAKASEWIVRSAVYAAEKSRPQFFYIYLPLLDYEAQRTGPESAEAQESVREADKLIAELASGMQAVYDEDLLWIIAGEYVITPVGSVGFPNRVLREEGYLRVYAGDDGEYIDWDRSRAFALADHQIAHVFVLDGEEATVAEVAEIFRSQPDVDRLLRREQLAQWGLDHPRSGDIVLIAQPTSWFAYYWWMDDANAPSFTRGVDIHRKPGYDPVELFWDPNARGIPLDPTLVKGSHGVPAEAPWQRTVLLISRPTFLPEKPLADTDVFQLILRLFHLAS